ncbi:MAG: restriction endonuclease subunit S, partial [Helicobacter sp.]|nr:restriction endonuclease subunit S [Helicobacter sp.]
HNASFSSLVSIDIHIAEILERLSDLESQLDNAFLASCWERSERAKYQNSACYFESVLADEESYSVDSKRDSSVVSLLQNDKATFNSLLQSLPIPPKEGWERKKISDIFQTSSGGTPLTTNKEYYNGGTIYWVNSGELKNGIIVDTEVKITELGLQNSSAKIFPKETVLIAMYGATTGEVGILDIEASTNQAICAILPNKDEANPYFVFYMLRTKTKDLKKLSRGVARNNISQDIIKNLQIPLPPLETQNKIVTTIETTESKIARLDSILSCLETQKQVILQKALFA